MKSPWMRRLALLACLSSLPLLAAADAPASAKPAKTLRYILPAAETGFDPATARDLYSNHITQAVFDTLYTYDYLARPVKVVPQAAAALPEVSSDGKTYTIRLKKGILYTPDAAFGGKRRELTMADYVYSWKRLFDLPASLARSSRPTTLPSNSQLWGEARRGSNNRFHEYT